MVAVSVAVVVSSTDWRVVSQFSVNRRRQTAVLRLLNAERDHALGYRQTMSQMFRHRPSRNLYIQNSQWLKSSEQLGSSFLKCQTLPCLTVVLWKYHGFREIQSPRMESLNFTNIVKL